MDSDTDYRAKINSLVEDLRAQRT